MKRIDVPPGTVFGRLTVTGETRAGARNVRAMVCRCECGAEMVVQLSHLTTGHTTSCGCLRYGVGHEARRADLAATRLADIPPGTVFGRLTAIEPARTPGGRSAMLCQCECGGTAIVTLSTLRSGVRTSCGCAHYGDVADPAQFGAGEIPLYGKRAAGRVAVVDDDEYEAVSQYRWYPSGPYAHTHVYRNGVRTFIMMHTLITGWALVDHWDGNGLNNRRSNLREATATQNAVNRRKQSKPASSRYKGVCWKKAEKVWEAYIYDQSKQIHLGRFATAEDAARAYDAAALAQWGEFACLNFPDAGSRSSRAQ